MNPLVSVIIPTANRPHYLPRAVESALAGVGGKEIEVIVVPNGSDQSWRESLASFKDNPSVRVIPIAGANANIARNTGMEHARGEFIRFLDDDDYLIPKEAVKQYEVIKNSNLDIISGSIKIENENGQLIRVWHQPEVTDFCAATLGPLRCCQPTAHVIRKSCLDSLQWNPDTKMGQDIEWLMNICANREINWKVINKVVGVWVHHTDSRISKSKGLNEINKLNVQLLIRIYEKIMRQGRMNEPRKIAVAQGIWARVHAAYFLEPKYWGEIARIAGQVQPGSRPVQPLYDYFILRNFSPLFIQSLLFPKRWIFYQLKKITK